VRQMLCNTNESRRFGKSRWICGLLVLGVVLLAGCGIGSARKGPLEMKVRDLEREQADLTGQLEQSQIEAEQLKSQIKALASLPPDKKESLFYSLSTVTIGGFTGFYDKNKDGKRQDLIVYVQPTDKAGDLVKAPGVVSVQLWNLNDPNSQALLGQWQVQPPELYKLWFNTLAITAFRLTFDVPTPPALLAQPLTVRMTFTDYLTGQVFTDQFVIQPKK
jgi:outer membrane murein-binding lipoprotein Lpp